MARLQTRLYAMVAHQLIGVHRVELMKRQCVYMVTAIKSNLFQLLKSFSCERNSETNNKMMLKYTVQVCIFPSIFFKIIFQSIRGAEK